MPKSYAETKISTIGSAAIILDFLNKAAEEDQCSGLPQINLLGGGKWFVSALIQYGITEQDQPIRLSKPLLEVAELIGDFRVSTTALTGAAQVFKSLLTWNLAAALITVGRSRIGWVLPQASLIPKIIPSYWRPIIAHWEEQLGVSRKARQSDSKSMAIYQSVHGTARFLGANNPNEKRKNTDGLADANTNLVSASIDTMLTDEQSQFPASVITVLARRMEQSNIETQPWRLTGTPGAGAGIEKTIRMADRDFYSYAQCENCGEASALHPLGWLLKPVHVDGSPTWFDSQGRPLAWHHRDKLEPINSAYYGCPNCNHEISRDDRMNSWFQCQKSKQKLRDFLDGLPTESPYPKITAGVTLSPLIRDKRGNTAAGVLRDGIEGEDPYDWQQQALGISTTSVGGGITIALVERAVKTPIPAGRVPSVIGFGLDQGQTHGQWIIKVIFYLPNDALSGQLSKAQLYEQTHREIVWAAPLTNDELASDIGTYLLKDCDGGGIDNEPERDWAARFQAGREGCVLFDQRGDRDLNGKIWQPRIVQSAGSDLDVFGIDTHRFQNKILGCFASGKYTISCPCDPQDTRGERSLTRHLVASTRNSETLKWSRPNDKIDDLLKALVGAELWFYLHIFGELPRGEGSFWKAAANVNRF